jgi:hypothetical protein
MNQLIQQSNKVYSVDFAALTNGYSTNAVVVGSDVAPFYLGQSQILGIVCKTPGGVPGIVSITQMVGANAQGNPTASMRLASSTNADTSVYTLIWTNSTVVGGSLTAGGAPAQPA